MAAYTVTKGTLSEESEFLQNCGFLPQFIFLRFVGLNSKITKLTVVETGRNRFMPLNESKRLNIIAKDTFCLDENNVVILNQYKNSKNYSIWEKGNSNLCYIFCSSNGIYYPNTNEIFTKTILSEDRYEWQKVADSDEISKVAGKVIFIRDVYKQYYVKGINSKINTVDKLCEFLKEETQGMEVICCGISSGGYIATILGIALKAFMVFNFGGQWSLYEELKEAEKENKVNSDYYFLNEGRKKYVYNKWYNITKMLENNTIPIIYFYSALNENDKKQIEIFNHADTSNVYCFAMKSSNHGYTLFHSCYRKVLTCPLQKLLFINSKYKGRCLSLRKMCFYLLDKKEALKECIKDIVKEIVQK